MTDMNKNKTLLPLLRYLLVRNCYFPNIAIEIWKPSKMWLKIRRSWLVHRSFSLVLIICAFYSVWLQKFVMLFINNEGKYISYIHTQENYSIICPNVQEGGYLGRPWRYRACPKLWHMAKFHFWVKRLTHATRKTGNKLIMMKILFPSNVLISQ